MKKSLLALAVLGAFAGAASAQSSVTIYGILDQGITKGNGGNAFNSGGNGTSKAWILKQATPSRLGFRGSEDMGGGLSAQFQIEHRFTPDDGQAAQPFWFGRSFVQLTSKAAGSVYLGREYAPFFWLAAKSDPFGLDGPGRLLDMLYLLAGTHETNPTPSTSPASRTQNTVGYKSPNFGGLTVQAAVGLGEGTVPGGRDTGFNVEYGAGPIYAAVGFGKKKGGAVSDGDSLVNLALHYDLGVVKLMGYYGRSKTGVNNNDTNKFVSLGARAPIGPGVLKAAIGQLDVEGSDRPLDLKKFSLGYDYPLSKRTNLYADVGSARSDNNAVKDNTTYALGLKHTF